MYTFIFTVELMIGAGIQDLTPGVKDPSVFDVPAICKQAVFIYILKDIQCMNARFLK